MNADHVHFRPNPAVWSVRDIMQLLGTLTNKTTGYLNVDAY